MEHQVTEMAPVQLILVILHCAVVLVFLKASVKLFHVNRFVAILWYGIE